MKFEEFINKYYEISGVDLNKYHWDQLERRLKNFLSNYFSVNKEDKNIFSLAIKELKLNSEFRIEIYEALTINHSYFFRNKKQWDFLISLIKDTNKKKLKIWSAGCSSGEEPYSLAMFLDNLFPNISYKIYASDIDVSILNKAKEGKYENFSLERELDQFYWNKYFVKENDIYKVDSKLKDNIIFFQHNLLDEPIHDNFDIVICRNVLIYFSNIGKDIIFNYFSESLKDNGILFLGPTEQIFDSENFNLKLIKPSFYTKNMNDSEG